MSANAPIIIFLMLYVAASACAVAGSALMWGAAVALFTAAPFVLGLCGLVGIGIARNG